AEFAAWHVRIRRHLRHDLSTALAIVKMAVQRGFNDEADKHISTISAWLYPGNVATIKLRRFTKAVTSLVGYAHGSDILYDDDGDFEVTTSPSDIHRALLNALINAAEAQRVSGSDGDIRVHVGSDFIRITNPANRKDRRMVLRSNGSTKGNGRGTGRGSIARSVARIGWTVEYAVEGETVVTTLRWPDVECYDQDDEGAKDDVQAKPQPS
ncbi:MAG: hypothetical protein GTN70_09365, partial [Deltaproteobacteria bacterium]|nr:hypothetical protein [Deltaproteobacteria bacterium]